MHRFQGPTPLCVLASLIIGIPVISFIGCKEQSKSQRTLPLIQRGYLWQRDWSPAVERAMGEAEDKMDGIVILGAEIHWDGNTPEIVHATVPWAILKNSQKPFSVALRIDPFPGPFVTNDIPFQTIQETATSLIKSASDHGVLLAEFQIDFDCAQNKLNGYRSWVKQLRQVVHPLPLVITTLPSWLNEADFLTLAESADGYVLQVHSVPTKQEIGRSVLCDPALARKWVAKASGLGIPFSVSLPTYHSLAGYAPSGKLIGLLMDSVQPSWPPNTHTLDFSANPDQIAELVKEWQTSRPPGMKELIWYRIPVGTDQQNWRWPTLNAVMQGRIPIHHVEVVCQGENPIDLILVNTGEAEEQVHGAVTISWGDAELVAYDALSGWGVYTGKEQVEFKSNPEGGQRLSPGERRFIGWLRFNKPTTIKTNLQQAGL
jgi:hypothetical protein